MNILSCIFNSKIWFHLYYKHTKQHKLDCKLTKDRVLARRRELIGK